MLRTLFSVISIFSLEWVNESSPKMFIALGLLDRRSYLNGIKRCAVYVSQGWLKGGNLQLSFANLMVLVCYRCARVCSSSGC